MWWFGWREAILIFVFLLMFILMWACNHVIVDYFFSKPLGKQTILDFVYCDFASLFASVPMLVCCFCLLREAVFTSVPHHFAIGLAWTLDFLVCSLVVYLSLVTLVRYAHIFHRFIFEDFGLSDAFFIWSVRGISALISVMRIGFLVVMQQEPREYVYLTGRCLWECDNGDFLSALTMGFIGLLVNVVLNIIIRRENNKDHLRFEWVKVDVNKLESSRKQTKGNTGNNFPIRCSQSGASTRRNNEVHPLAFSKIRRANSASCPKLPALSPSSSTSSTLSAATKKKPYPPLPPPAPPRSHPCTTRSMSSRELSLACLPGVLTTEREEGLMMDSYNERVGKADFRHDRTNSTTNNTLRKEMSLASTEISAKKTVKICVENVEKDESCESLCLPDENRPKKEVWNRKNIVKSSLKFGAWFGVATVFFSCFGLVVTLDPVEQGTEARLIVCLLGGLVFQMMLIACNDNFRRHAVRKAGMCLGREHWLVRVASRAVMHRKVGVTTGVGEDVHASSHCGLC